MQQIVIVNNMKTLVVVDMQNDFLTGVLGVKNPEIVINNVCELIRNWKGNIIVTLDTHGCDYLETREGNNLPIVHCVKPTSGWQINDEVAKSLSMKPRVKYVEKDSFGQFYWDVDDEGEITLVGVCSDICVINNALILRNLFKSRQINVVEDCCAGTTEENHKKAMDIMKINHINIL